MGIKVLHVGIFNDHCLGGDIILKKGFVNNSIDHCEFDYRAIATQSSIEIMNKKLVSQAKGFDIVFIGKGELLRSPTLSAIRKSGSHVCIWYGDARPVPDDWLIDNLKECDTLFMTSSGKILELYFRMGNPGRAAFFLNPCNPELTNKYVDIPRSVDLPLYSGTLYDFMGNERRQVYEYLCHRGDIQIVGSPTRFYRNYLLQRLFVKLKPVQYVRGDEYIQKIIRARFGIGVSAYQNIKYYTSDRLMHYLSFGKLYLAFRFLGCEELFTDKEHLVYYDDIEDLDVKIKMFLTNKELAEQVGYSGMKKVHTEYNTTNMVKMMLDIMDTGRSSMFPWVEIYK